MQGRGRWDASRLQLQLQTQSVRPERLDARAGVFEISGPLSLDLTGVPVPTQRDAKTTPWQAQVQADLAGSVGAARVPLKLEAAGSFSADEIDLPRLLELGPPGPAGVNGLKMKLNVF